MLYTEHDVSGTLVCATTSYTGTCLQTAASGNVFFSVYTDAYGGQTTVNPSYWTYTFDDFYPLSFTGLQPDLASSLGAIPLTTPGPTTLVVTESPPTVVITPPTVTPTPATIFRTASVTATRTASLSSTAAPSSQSEPSETSDATSPGPEPTSTPSVHRDR